MSRHPFDDRLHAKAADADDIRLISEGGCSPTKSPGPVCIDSIQVTHNCTTESQHTSYRSATGACTMFAAPDTSIFSVSPEHASELDKGAIPDVIRTRFEQHGVPLSDRARVSVQQLRKIWVISDQDDRYSIRKLAQNLTVYREPQLG